VGYYRVQTLVPILDTQTTEFYVGFQAVTPAGLESDGLAEGHTVVSPTVALFHDLGGVAVQGVVGKHVPTGPRGTDTRHRGLQYGFAVQQPVSLATNNASANLHLFVEALGRQRRDFVVGPRVLPNWELLPGLQWRLSESCWMSGGVILPL